MSRKYRIYDQADLQFMTYATVDWVDALSRPAYKDIIVESFRFCQEQKGLQLYAWCIMSNHVHLIAKADPGPKLEDIMRDHKKHTSKALMKAIAENGKESRREWMLKHFRKSGGSSQFWQHDLHPIWIRTPEVVERYLNYLHRNPVAAGLVKEPEHYVYSSAGSYLGLPSMLDVILI
ncbi:MAG: transposase [Flavobacteriales bacterium]|jgi:REP element-mobilizing transposase RayT|nr:transposase [Flavobacteriales bacterium]MBK7246474.1 transposase [Flavobacteriales bacterium]QQS72158.1 MAG: transposase [Flavobacteriales bacterium]HQV37862.1 transposase [Flavobacteriales bacterium]HQW31614.1 transposase [Flavobacteriales bacterium]